MLTIGTLTLDDDPYVNVSYQYTQASNGRVIGGTKKITLTGTIIANNASDLIDESNTIKDWFAQSDNRYISSVTINNQLYSFIIVENVTIDSEDWVSSINYTIELIAQIEASAVLPSNILNLTYADHLTGLDITESMSFQADKQNTYYLTAGGFKSIEDSITWEMKMSVTCRRSALKTPIQNAYDILSNILISTPDRTEFNEYKDWNMYLQTRSLETNPVNGSLSFSCKITLIPDDIVHPAFINISSSTNHNYISNNHSRNVSLTSTGLIPIQWTSIIDLSEFCVSGKLANAQNAINILINWYRDLVNFPGTDIDPANPSCNIDCNLTSNNICYIPKTITVTKNATDGKISANIEWATDSDSCSNGLSIEVEKTENNIDQTIVENSNFWIVRPIVTNLNCNKARIWSYNISVSSKYSCPQENLITSALVEYNTIRNSLDPNVWFEIRKISQQNNNSYTLTVDYVEACP